MQIQEFLHKLNNSPETIQFTDTITTVDTNYQFTPTRFRNGEQINEAGQNSGSCKLFSFAQLHQLDTAQTLACFGDYYRVDVLENPQGEDHQNIRNFIKYGWEGVDFEGQALTPRE